jgi:hypothetical protein
MNFGLIIMKPEMEITNSSPIWIETVYQTRHMSIVR